MKETSNRTGENKKRKRDRRSIETEEAIKQALLDALASTTFNQVAISDLAAKAHITRATFYRHYSNVADVLDEIMEDVLSNVGDVPFSLCEACANTNVGSNNPSAWQGIPFCHLLASGNPYRVLLEDEAVAGMLIERLVDAGLDKTEAALRARFPDTSLTRQQLRYYNIFRMSGCLSAVKAARRDGYDWSLMQPTLDAAIASAFNTLG